MILNLPERSLDDADSSRTRALPARARPYLFCHGLLDLLCGTACLAGILLWLWPGILTLRYSGVVIAVVIVVELVALAVGCIMRVAFTRYGAVTESVTIAQGFFFRRSRHIPTARILNVDIVQGPIERLWDLVTVRFSTVAGVLRLGPVPSEEAARLRNIVIGVDHHDSSAR